MKKTKKQKTKRELLEELAAYYLPSEYFIYPSDGRNGKLLSIATRINGAIHTHTAFMNYIQMDAYLKGFGNVDRLKHKESQI